MAKSIRLIALLAAPFAFPVLLFYGIIAYLYISTKFSPPVYSSSFSIPELNATIKLEFYRVWDETQESGKFLTASTARGSVRSEIAGFDWVHNARTSIYETPQHDVAVLSPMEDDYVVNLRTLELKTLSPFASSDGWRYIGAFDFGGAAILAFNSFQLLNRPSASQCACRATSIGRNCLVPNIGSKSAIRIRTGWMIMPAGWLSPHGGKGNVALCALSGHRDLAPNTDPHLE